MRRGLRALWTQYRAVERAATEGVIITYEPEAAKHALYTAKASIDTLERELYAEVMGNGGVHGSEAAAFAAWIDLAQSTSDLLDQTLGYTQDWGLTGILARARDTAVAAAQNVATGAIGIVSLAKWIAAAVIVYVIAKEVRR